MNISMRIEFVEAPPNEKLERFHLKFKTMFAEEYRDEVMRLTQEKRRERVTKRGLLLPGAWPLFGYTWDNEVKKGRYVIDEEAAAIVRRIFALAASGMSLNAICRLLNAEGVPTPSVYQHAHGRLPEGRAVGSAGGGHIRACCTHQPIGANTRRFAMRTRMWWSKIRQPEVMNRSMRYGCDLPAMQPWCRCRQTCVHRW